MASNLRPTSGKDNPCLSLSSGLGHNKAMTKIKTLLFLTLLAGAHASHAAELAGVSFPDTLSLEGHAKVLNGLGLRLATFIKIKVYVAGLYVSHKSKDAATLLLDKESKLIRMSFLRDLAAEKLREALSEGFEKACKGEECKTFDGPVKSFVKLQPDLKKGEVLDFELMPEEIVVKKGEKELGRVKAPGLAHVMLRIWIGDNPPNKELKSGLLGN